MRLIIRGLKNEITKLPSVPVGCEGSWAVITRKRTKERKKEWRVEQQIGVNFMQNWKAQSILKKESNKVRIRIIVIPIFPTNKPHIHMDSKMRKKFPHENAMGQNFTLNILWGWGRGQPLSHWQNWNCKLLLTIEKFFLGLVKVINKWS